MYYRNNYVSFTNKVLYRLKLSIIYYCFTWIIYILDAYDLISTFLLFSLVPMSNVSENVITPVFISSSSYDFVERCYSNAVIYHIIQAKPGRSAFLASNIWEPLILYQNKKRRK